MSLNTGIEKLITELTGGVIKREFSGGSTARTVLLSRNETDTVLKLAITDGLNNGRRKLTREANQIKYLKSKYPSFFANLLPEIHATYTNRAYAGVEYTFYQGKTVAEIVDDISTNSAELNQHMYNILNIALKGYKLNLRKRKNTFLEDKNIKRTKFRLAYTGKSSDQLMDAVNSPEITINGEVYINPMKIIDEIESSHDLMETLRATRLGECIHGDMNLCNIFYDNDKNYKFLDVRGSVQKWDLFYDLGKLLFTASFDDIKKVNYKTDILNSSTFSITNKNPNRYTIANWDCVLVNFESILESHPEFQEIIKYEPHWKSRLRFCFSLHFLADCACRVVAGSPLEQPLASYLIGTIYLNRFIKDASASSAPDRFYVLPQSINNQ